MTDTLATLLALTAQQRGRCACSDATRLEVAGVSIPVGPATALLVLTLALFAPPFVASLFARRREARAMRRVLDDAPGA